MKCDCERGFVTGPYRDTYSKCPKCHGTSELTEPEEWKYLPVRIYGIAFPSWCVDEEGQPHLLKFMNRVGFGGVEYKERPEQWIMRFPLFVDEHGCTVDIAPDESTFAPATPVRVRIRKGAK